MFDDSGENNGNETENYTEDTESETAEVHEEPVESDRQETAEKQDTSGKRDSPGKSETVEKSENHEKEEVDYSRPGWRSGIKDEVWENAKDEHGRVRDPMTGRYMSKDQPWDIGHKPGYEFRKYQEYAREKGMSRKEFIEGYNNVEHLRPELPSSNRSHKCEDMTDKYFGEEE